MRVVSLELVNRLSLVYRLGQLRAFKPNVAHRLLNIHTSMQEVFAQVRPGTTNAGKMVLQQPREV
jgi:hypothetical protein